MAPLRTGVYIDGLNFYYGALRDTPHKWLDLQSFASRLVPRDELVHVRYFTAIVNSRPEDPRIPIRQETYIRALETFPLVSIHRGRFTTRVRTRVLADAFEHHRTLFDPHFRPRTVFDVMWKDKVRRRNDSSTRVRVVIEEAKGSDVNLGVHLVHDAASKLIDKAIVVSNDSDLAEAIRLARGLGLEVGLLNPQPGPTSKHLKDVMTFEVPFRRAVLADCQLPVTIHDHRGRQIHKPREWR